MRCFYDGSKTFLQRIKDDKYCVMIITEDISHAKFVYTKQIHAPFSLAEKCSVDMQNNEQGFFSFLSSKTT